MNPEKILDLSVKFGVLPFMIYMIFITRSDLQEVKENLSDCYEDRIEDLRPNPITNTTPHEENTLFAILTDNKRYTKKRR